MLGLSVKLNDSGRRNERRRKTFIYKIGINSSCGGSLEIADKVEIVVLDTGPSLELKEEILPSYD